jgi:hypothetical protein
MLSGKAQMPILMMRKSTADLPRLESSLFLFLVLLRVKPAMTEGSGAKACSTVG